MTFGQQPQNNGQYNPHYNTPDYNAAQQSGYGQQYAQSGYGQNYYAQPQGAPTYQYVPQGTGAACGHHLTTMRRPSADRDDHRRRRGRRARPDVMTTSFLDRHGLIGLCVVQIALAVVLGMRVTKMKSVVLIISIFMVYDLGSIGVALGVTAGRPRHDQRLA